MQPFGWIVVEEVTREEVSDERLVECGVEGERNEISKIFFLLVFEMILKEDTKTIGSCGNRS